MTHKNTLPRNPSPFRYCSLPPDRRRMRDTYSSAMIPIFLGLPLMLLGLSSCADKAPNPVRADAPAAASGRDPATPWWRETFVISTFAAVRTGDDIDAVVARLADLGLNAFECNTPLEYAAQDLTHEERTRALEASAKHGLRLFVTDHKRLTGVADPTREAVESVVRDYSRYPALGGYYVWDEPGPAQFPAVRKIYDVLRELDPSRLPLNAMVPSYGPHHYPDDYPEFARQFLDTVDPPVISFDFYGLSQPPDDRAAPIAISPDLYRDLDLWSSLARDRDKPLWFYPSSCHWATIVRPTAATLRFQVYTAAAYGAKGIQYFVARSFTGDKIDFVDAPLSPDGTPGATYDAFKEVNRELAAIGPALMQLEKDRVIHTDPVPHGAAPLRGGHAGILGADNDLILGFLRDPAVPASSRETGNLSPTPKTARRFVLVVNKDLKSERNVFLRFDGPTVLVPYPEATPLAASDHARFLLPAGGGRLFEIRSNPALSVRRPDPMTDKNLVRWVDPFVGTDNNGNTFPGAVVPFGMVQLSPDTELWAPGGYRFSDAKIRQFSHTHLSGVGCPAYGEIALMPVTGPVETLDLDKLASEFDHAKEAATAGWYGVELKRYGIRVELTAGERTGWHRYHFPAASQGAVVFRPGQAMGAHVVDAAELSIVGDRRIEGSVVAGGFCGITNTNRYTLYYAIECERPFAEFGTGEGDTIVRGERNRTGPAAAAYLAFDTKSSGVAGIRVALSFVSLEGARKNLEAETKGMTFDSAKEKAAAAWNEALGAVRVSGGSDYEYRVFYTALYHSLMHPNVFSDVDGRYIGFDGAIHTAEGYTQLANFSMWDTYRTVHPLFAVVAPDRGRDAVLSLLADAREGGWLPKWTVANAETNIMSGDPVSAILVDGFVKGLYRDVDAEEAYGFMKRFAMEPPPAGSQYEGRPGVEEYWTRGFVPSEDPEGRRWGIDTDLPGGASVTLEYGLADCGLARMAKALGHDDDAKMFLAAAQNYRNLFDPQTGWIRPRLADGTWLTPFDSANSPGYEEASGCQYHWLVPHDPAGLVDLMGGRQKAAARMDHFFDLPAIQTDPHRGSPVWGARNRFDLGNEPDIQAPYLYPWTGQPWKTQAVVNASRNVYALTPSGIAGNDDLGTMSAWYVFSALGFYPLLTGGDYYILTSPLFDEAVIRLDKRYYDADTLTIRARGASEGKPFIQSATLNGQPWNKAFLLHDAIREGATLEFILSDRPNEEWAASPADEPPPPCGDPRPDPIRSPEFRIDPATASLDPSAPFEIVATLVNTLDVPIARARIEVVASAGWTLGGPATLRLDSIAPGESRTPRWTLAPENPAALHPAPGAPTPRIEATLRYRTDRSAPDRVLRDLIRVTTLTVLEWNFDEPDNAEGWRAADPATKIAATGGALHVSAQGGNATVALEESLCIDLAAGLPVALEIDSPTAGEGILTWDADADTPSADRSVGFDIPLGKSICVAFLPPRTGALRSIRIQLPAASKPAAIDRISVPAIRFRKRGFDFGGRAIGMSEHNYPAELLPSHTLAQTFTVSDPFVAAAAKLATYFATDSAVTLSLYRVDGGKRFLAARSRIRNVSDNAWTACSAFAQFAPGEYILECSSPRGRVAWWSHDAGRFKEGEALQDGNPVAGDRALQVHLAPADPPR